MGHVVDVSVQQKSNTSPSTDALRVGSTFRLPSPAMSQPWNSPPRRRLTWDASSQYLPLWRLLATVFLLLTLFVQPICAGLYPFTGPDGSALTFPRLYV